MRPRVFTSLLIAIAILGMVHLLIRTSTYGAAVAGDSVRYLSAAENFAAGKGWIIYDGRPILTFPPFFSMLLGFISLFGIEPIDAGRFVNIAAFGAIIAISGLYLGRNIRSRLLALGVAVVIMTSYYFSDFCSHVLTEPLFILFSLLALMPLGSVSDRRGEKRALALSALFAALASAIRYIGVTAIVAAVLVISMRRGKPMGAKLKDAFIYAVFSSIPITLFSAFNYAVSGTPWGNRHHVSGQSIFESLEQIVWGAGRRILPSAVATDWLVYAVLGAVGLIGVGMVAFATIFCKERSPSHRWEPFLPFVAFALVYLAILALSIPFTVPVPIHARFLLPAVVPALLVGAFLLDQFLHSEARGKMVAVKWALATPILMGCVANVGFNVQRNYAATVQHYHTGYESAAYNSYNTARWANFEIVEYLRTHPIAGRIYTNSPGLLWWLSDVPPPIMLAPRNIADDCLPWLRRALAKFQRDSEAGSRARQTFSRLQRDWETEEAHIVWLKIREDVTCRIPESELPAPLERVASFSDGAVYRIALDGGAPSEE